MESFLTQFFGVQINWMITENEGVIPPRNKADEAGN